MFQSQFEATKQKLKIRIKNLIDSYSSASIENKPRIKYQANTLNSIIIVCGWVYELEMDFHLMSGDWAPQQKADKAKALQVLQNTGKALIS